MELYVHLNLPFLQIAPLFIEQKWLTLPIQYIQMYNYQIFIWRLRWSLAYKLSFSKSLKCHHIRQEMSACVICSILRFAVGGHAEYVNSAVCSMFAASGWGNAWRPRATVRASTTPSGIGKSLQFPWRLSDLPWLHVAASDLHWRPSPDMEDWRLSMQKPLLIQQTGLCTPCSWITVLTSSA